MLSQDAIAKFKEVLVYSIQKKLSNNSSSMGPQCITIPCMKSQFVDVFDTESDINTPNNEDSLKQNHKSKRSTNFEFTVQWV
ncbi:3946_t:CDS:2 [Racocetra persica]|uniref:3946_t:CDS:1 n=1 Tax=Racocetra persica TaxID=160502 RepID=A0ACA9LWR3_9GLOM|nr:3946_t:CDS:2 [Racocetra persica]